MYDSLTVYYKSTKLKAINLPTNHKKPVLKVKIFRRKKSSNKRIRYKNEIVAPLFVIMNT